MNNKGFTTIELILTIVLVVVIMATITNVTYTYRDRSEYEKTLTEVTNYKNNLTKIIYDDILKGPNRVVGISKINNNSYRLYTTTTTAKSFQIIDETSKVGINYDGVEYLVPGCEDGLVTLETVSFYSANNIYKLDVVFRHRNLEELIKIHFVIS